MARRLDRILVIDVESTCWDGPPPQGQVSEIIEIGAGVPCHILSKMHQCPHFCTPLRLFY